MVHENRKKSINPSVIAVIVLLAIALVSGLLLSVLNDILYISDEERTARDLSKVYQSESFTQLTIDENFKSKDEYGEIVYVYQAADGAYVIEIQPADIGIYTGGDGYAGVLKNEDGDLLNEPAN